MANQPRQDSEEPQRSPDDIPHLDPNVPIEEMDLAAYIAFLEGIPTENAIARRFISAAHMLARAVLVNAVFTFVRSLEFNWEESAEMTGDILNMSRSSVARSVSDVERLVQFWNSTGYHIARVEDVIDQVSALTKRRLADALDEKAEDDEREHSSD